MTQQWAESSDYDCDYILVNFWEAKPGIKHSHFMCIDMCLGSDSKVSLLAAYTQQLQLWCLFCYGRLKPEYDSIAATSELLNPDGSIKWTQYPNYLLFGKGPLATTACDRGAFVNTRGELYADANVDAAAETAPAVAAASLFSCSPSRGVPVQRNLPDTTGPASEVSLHHDTVAASHYWPVMYCLTVIELALSMQRSCALVSLCRRLW